MCLQLLPQTKIKPSFKLVAKELKALDIPLVNARVVDLNKFLYTPIIPNMCFVKQILYVCFFFISLFFIADKTMWILY
jgi:hypothetical protein